MVSGYSIADALALGVYVILPALLWNWLCFEAVTRAGRWVRARLASR
jgi:hypothetical protein